MQKSSLSRIQKQQRGRERNKNLCRQIKKQRKFNALLKKQVSRTETHMCTMQVLLLQATDLAL